jgi:putative tryptophan/tyrosine transport system substrate-binding protein
VRNSSRLLLILLTLASAHLAEAQQSAKVRRIGYLTTGRLDNTPENRKAFRQGLRDLGYVEGKNIVIEWRQGDWKRHHVPVLAAELVRLKVDVIVTTGSWDTRVTKDATAIIPIVMTNDADPVGNGFVISLARPGGNITGLARLRPELSGKRLELLQEAVPGVKRVAVLTTVSNFTATGQYKQVEVTAGALGAQLQILKAHDPETIDSAFVAMINKRAQALIVILSISTAYWSRMEGSCLTEQTLPTSSVVRLPM